MRDLFRKSGRALEKEVELVPVEPVRQHRFPDDDIVLDLPGGSRGAQIAAVDEAFGIRAGRALGGVRRDVRRRLGGAAPRLARAALLRRAREQAHPGAALDADDAAQGAAQDLQGRAAARRRGVPDGARGPRPAQRAGVDGHVDLRRAALRLLDGPRRDGLARRGARPRGCETRGVTVLLSTPALDLELSGGRVVGVRTESGTVDADQVVCAIDPRRLPALAPSVERTMPAIPPVVCHIGVVGTVPDLPAEVVLHGDPMLVLRTGGVAPAGAHAWTILGRGRLAEDIVTALQRSGIRVRDQVEVRVDRSPLELVQEWGGSPYGVLWQGRNTVSRRLGPRTPIENVFMAGAHATPGAGLPSVGLSAALVAQVIGPA